LSLSNGQIKWNLYYL